MDNQEPDQHQNTDSGKARASISQISEQIADLLRELQVIAASEREKEKGHSRGVRLAGLIETHWAVRLAVFASTVLIVFVGIFGAIIYIEERQARIEERTARAWQNLATPSVGNSGKGLSINHLSDVGVELDYADLSCRAMGGFGVDPDALPNDPRPDFYDERCIRPPVISSVATQASSQTSFQNVDFRDAIVVDSLFEAAHFANANFTATRFEEVTFSNTSMCFVNWAYGELDRVVFDDLHTTCFGDAPAFQMPSASLEEVVIRDSDFSSTCFSNSSIFESSLVRSNLSQSIFFQTQMRDVSFADSNLSNTAWIAWTTPWFGDHYLELDQLWDTFQTQLETNPPSIGLFDADRRNPTVVLRGEIHLGCKLRWPLPDHETRPRVSEFLNDVRKSLSDVEAIDSAAAQKFADYPGFRRGAARFKNIDFSGTFVVHRFETSAEREEAMEKAGQAFERLGQLPRPRLLAEASDILTEIGLPAHFLGDPLTGYKIGFEGVLKPEEFFPAMLPGLPASAGPQSICIVDDDTPFSGAALRPPAEFCLINPWFKPTAINE